MGNRFDPRNVQPVAIDGTLGKVFGRRHTDHDFATRYPRKIGMRDVVGRAVRHVKPKRLERLLPQVLADLL